MPEEREQLVQRFRELRALENDAYRLYKSLLPLINVAADKQLVEGIMRDEQRHAEMAERIMQLIEGTRQEA